jgi:hypothetical protein
VKAKRGARSVDDSVPHPLWRAALCIFDTPEGLCGEHMLFTVDSGSGAGRSSGCTAPALARPVRRPPAISNRGSRRCIQNLPASAHWPQSGQHQTRPPILDINAAGDGPGEPLGHQNMRHT